MDRNRIQPDAAESARSALGRAGRQWCVWLFLGLLSFAAIGRAQTATNLLELERSASGLRLRYAVRDTNGVFFLLQADRIQTLLNSGQVLLSGSAASRPSGVLDLPLPANPAAGFFSLVQDPTGRLKGAPFVAPPRLIWIPPGTFTMGSPATEKNRDTDEGPQTAVTLTRGFYMGQYEVTQAEYLAVMTNNPSTLSSRNGYPEDLNRPVETVSWEDATNYCGRLTELERAAGRVPAGWAYRLPTEAEWEYACRAGTNSVFSFGNDLRSGMANFDGRSEYYGAIGVLTNPNGLFVGRTTAVGSYKPNAWGLYDMHGNVYEWCADWYGSYPGGKVTDLKGPATGTFRVFRGGCFETGARLCRSALRNFSWSTVLSPDIGFRVVLTPE